VTGKHIELFLVDGEPGGITTAEIAGWTGHVLTGPRKDIGEILRRPEAGRNGAYLLLGDDDEAIGGVTCYIGRTENFIHRFRDHKANKDYWDRVVLITAKDDAFNEGHWGYLEARLVEKATQAQRVGLMNTQIPQGRRLSEAQVSDMEAFIDHLQIILPVLGVNAIRQVRSRATDRPEKPVEASPVFRLAVPRTGVDASAQVNGDEFTLLAGSTVVAAWTGSGTTESTRRAYAALKARYDKLVADGSIVIEGGKGRVTRDIPFSSPSAAGAVASGRSCNGRRQWTWDGGTYGQWEERGLTDVQPDAEAASNVALIPPRKSGGTNLSGRIRGRSYTREEIETILTEMKGDH